MDEAPTHVCGAKAFVLCQPAVGRVEVGSPLPEDEIWKHCSGDLRFTAVHEISGGIAGGGGLSWDDDQLDVTWSEPGSGDNPDEGAWVVAGLIPGQFTSVIVEHGGQRFVQQPIRSTVVIPLDHAGALDSRSSVSTRTELRNGPGSHSRPRPLLAVSFSCVPPVR